MLRKVSTSFGTVPRGDTTSKGHFGAWLTNLENENVLCGKKSMGQQPGWCPKKGRSVKEEMGAPRTGQRGLPPKAAGPPRLSEMPCSPGLKSHLSRPSGFWVTRCTQPRAPPGQDPCLTPVSPAPRTEEERTRKARGRC